MKEKTKMIAGEHYNPLDPQLIVLRDRAGRICHRYNKKVFHEINLRNRLLRKLVNTTGNFWVKPPFYCDYGFNITLGSDVMLNYGCVLLDVCPITIGDKTLIGPQVQLVTACRSDPMSGSYGWGQHCDRSRQRGHPIPAGKCRCGRQSLPHPQTAWGSTKSKRR